MAWAPEQNVNVFDPLGCVVGLTLVAQQFESQKIGWVLPRTIQTTTTNTAPEAASIPKVGCYKMEKLPIANMVYIEQLGKDILTCKQCAKVFKTRKILKVHIKHNHTGTKVSY